MSTVRFLSICSGIEAASAAWAPLGWQAVGFSEIDPFACAVLAHHHPQAPNFGSLTDFRQWPVAALAEADVLVGGTPCQAFSVAGLRQSLADERGNLTLTLVHLYDHLTEIRHTAGRPAPVLVWENVPGVLNTPDNAFGCFLGGLAGEDGPLRPPGGAWHDAGYVRGPKRTIAWRVLDAQYQGLAQRRRRVFLVAGPRDGFCAEQVLFEFTGLRRDTPPRREAGEGTAPTLAARTRGGGGLGTDAECDGAVIAETIRGQAESSQPQADNESQESKLIPELSYALNPALANCLTRRMHKSINTTADEGQTPIIEITHTLRADGFDPCHPLDSGAHPPAIAFPERMSSTQCASTEDLSPSLQSRNPTAIAFNLRGREGGAMPEADPDGLAAMRAASGGSSSSYVATREVASALTGNYGKQPDNSDTALARGDDGRGYDRPEQVFGEVVGTLDTMKPHNVAISPSHSLPVSPSQSPAYAVRRLTPRECERLQGFPDDYTLIPWRGKPADLCPDSPRYKALGNSMAVPVMHWIGARLCAYLCQ